jgi:hypothetical protein
MVRKSSYLRNSQSPYSKMYLVTTSVYEKLLSSLDEKDTKTVDILNKDKDFTERPSEKYIESINTDEFEQPQLEAVNTDNLPYNMPDEFEEEVNPQENVEIFGQDEPQELINEQQSLQQPVQQTIENVQPMQMQTGPGPGNPNNPLRNECFPSVDPERLIPMVPFYKPGIKSQLQQGASKVIKKYKMVKPIIRSKLIVPSIMKQPVQQTMSNKLIVPPIMKQPVKQTIPRVPTFQTKKAKKVFKCTICFKDFARPWGLRRHIDTVHKNLQILSDPMRPENRTMETYQALPETDISMIDEPTTSKSFKAWGEDDKLSDVKKPGKRTDTQAKLKSRRPRKMRPDDADFPNWD